MKKVRIEITKASKTMGNKGKLILECTIEHNDFDEHDTAAILFASEFAINGNCELPLRAHILTHD